MKIAKSIDNKTQHAVNQLMRRCGLLTDQILDFIDHNEKSKFIRDIRNSLHPYSFTTILKASSESLWVLDLNVNAIKAVCIKYLPWEYKPKQTTEIPRLIDRPNFENISVDEFEVSVRIYKCLRGDGLRSLGDVLDLTPKQLRTVFTYEGKFNQPAYEDFIKYLRDNGFEVLDSNR